MRVHWHSRAAEGVQDWSDHLKRTSTWQLPELWNYKTLTINDKIFGLTMIGVVGPAPPALWMGCHYERNICRMIIFGLFSIVSIFFFFLGTPGSCKNRRSCLRSCSKERLERSTYRLQISCEIWIPATIITMWRPRYTWKTEMSCLQTCACYPCLRLRWRSGLKADLHVSGNRIRPKRKWTICYWLLFFMTIFIRRAPVEDNTASECAPTTTKTA